MDTDREMDMDDKDKDMDKVKDTKFQGSGCWIQISDKVYSDIWQQQNNVGLYPLQYDIADSNIRFSPISLIMDISLSAHLCVVSDQGGPNVQMLSFPCLCVTYVSGPKRVGSGIVKGGAGPALCMWMGQFSCSMELEWTGVCIHASQATTWRKGFKLKEF